MDMALVRLPGAAVPTMSVACGALTVEAAWPRLTRHRGAQPAPHLPHRLPADVDLPRAPAGGRDDGRRAGRCRL